jgi:hypothetical protein
MSFFRPGAETEPLDYFDSLSRLERRAQKLIAAEYSNESSNDYTIFGLLGYAIAIHTFYFLRDTPPGTPFFHCMSRRIRERLKKIDLHMLQFQYPEMMLWILIMGGIGGIGSSNRRYFALLLSNLCNRLGICGAAEIATSVKEFFWSDIYRSPATISFWRDVGLAQGVKKGYEVVPQPRDELSIPHFSIPPVAEEL